MKCANCHNMVTTYRIRRTFIERNITKRRRSKYQCGYCRAIFFV